MLSEHEQELLTSKCRTLPRREELAVADDYVLLILGMVLDFQMHQKTINKAFEYFKNRHQLHSHGELKLLIDSHPDSQHGNVTLANTLWNNNLWTRAEYLRLLVSRFGDLELQTLLSLSTWAEGASFKDDVHGRFKTAYHSMGYAMFQYLRMRLGHNTIKPDSRVQNFVHSIIQRKPSDKECVQGIETAARILQRSARELDAAIYSG